MRKLAFVLILTLVGCLNTTNHHPYRDGRSEEKPWWTTPYTADTPRDQNPWLKFVHHYEQDHGYKINSDPTKCEFPVTIKQVDEAEFFDGVKRLLGEE